MTGQKRKAKTFPSEASKRASESNLKGAMNKFEVVRQCFVPKILGPPTNQVNLQGQIQASLPAAAAATNQVSEKLLVRLFACLFPSLISDAFVASD